MISPIFSKFPKAIYLMPLKWRRKWQPTPVLLLGKSHGLSSLIGYSPWGQKESDSALRAYNSMNFQILK